MSRKFVSQELEEKYKKLIQEDLMKGMTLSEIMKKYEAMIKEEVYPQTFLVIMKIDAPDFAKASTVQRMIKTKLPTSHIFVIQNCDPNIEFGGVIEGLPSFEPESDIPS